MNYIVDLHMHSIYSDDGEFAPSHLVHKCQEQGIGILSITDHNSIRANKEAQLAAMCSGLMYIPGTEIDCTFEGVNFHVLGYNIDYYSSDFELIEKNIFDQFEAASKKMLYATQKLGFDVEEKDLRQLEEKMYWRNHWTGEMFAEVLLEKPQYKNHPLLEPYREGGSRSNNPFVNFYWDFYSQGKPCYVKFEYPTLQEVVNIIHKNGGIAILAHPGANLKGNEHLLKPIINTGIDGIEAFSSYHDQEQIEKYAQFVYDNNLLLSCGSDYHGKTKPSIKLGQHGCPNGLQKQLATHFHFKKRL